MHDILRIADGSTDIDVADLVKKLKVSPATLRRDLVELHDRGLITRSYGRIRVSGQQSEIPVTMRDSEASAAKRAIAKAAVQLLSRGPQAVAISGGTTTSEVARALGSHDGITIVTNALTIALEASRSPRLKVILTGGTLRATSLETVGPFAEASFTRLNVSTAFLGTDGVSVDGGVTTHDENEARTNGTMVQYSDRVIVVCDGSKIGKRTMAKMAGVAEIDILVTDEQAPSAELDAIRDAGVEVIVVG
jgi:DeoR family transcriptional regulator of aga operon